VPDCASHVPRVDVVGGGSVVLYSSEQHSSQCTCVRLVVVPAAGCTRFRAWLSSCIAGCWGQHVVYSICRRLGKAYVFECDMVAAK
jgi:hypothetical protein